MGIFSVTAHLSAGEKSERFLSTSYELHFDKKAGELRAQDTIWSGKTAKNLTGAGRCLVVLTAGAVPRTVDTRVSLTEQKRVGRARCCWGGSHLQKLWEQERTENVYSSTYNREIVSHGPVEKHKVHVPKRECCSTFDKAEYRLNLRADDVWK